ncbi:PREDICTED: uncharacterized protein LOC108557358 isoform X2 [Nicrophorus vespilloides]|nr:PREDICTED: uncharacterized protein LOC108557358 isoform X2 [Nicrophorus vespilloides]
MDAMGFDGSGIELLKNLYNAAVAEENLLLQRKAIKLLMRTCNFILGYLPSEPVRKNSQLEALKHLNLIRFTKGNSNNLRRIETRPKRSDYYVDLSGPIPVEITTRKYADSYKISDDSRRFPESTINKNFYFKFDLDQRSHRNQKRETQQEILLRKIEKANEEIEQIKADIRKLIEEINASNPDEKMQEINFDLTNSDEFKQEIDFIDLSLMNNVMTTDLNEIVTTSTEAPSLDDIEITTIVPDDVLSDSSEGDNRKTKIVGIQVVIENDFSTDSSLFIDDFSTGEELRIDQVSKVADAKIDNQEISSDDVKENDNLKYSTDDDENVYGNENLKISSDDEDFNEECATEVLSVEEELRITRVSEVADTLMEIGKISNDVPKEEFDVNIVDVTEKSEAYDVATIDSELNDKSNETTEVNADVVPTKEFDVNIVDVTEKDDVSEVADPELTDYESLMENVNEVVYTTMTPSEAPSTEELSTNQRTEEIDVTTISSAFEHIVDVTDVTDLDDRTANSSEDGRELERYTTEAADEETTTLMDEISTLSEEASIEVTTIQEASSESNNFEVSLIDVDDVTEVADSNGKIEKATSDSNFEESVEILNATVEPTDDGDHLTKTLLKIEINPETDENEEFKDESVLEDSVNEPSNFRSFRVKPDLIDSNFDPYDDDLLLVYPEDYNDEDFKEFGAKILPETKSSSKKSDKRLKLMRKNEAAQVIANEKLLARNDEALMRKTVQFPKKSTAFLKIEDKSERKTVKPKVVTSNSVQMAFESSRTVESPSVSLFKKYPVEELENANLKDEPNPALPEIFKALKSFNDSAEFDYVPTLIDWDASDTKSNFKNVSEVLTNIQEHINNSGKFVLSNATEPKKFVYVVVNKSLIASPMKKRVKRNLNSNYFENAVSRFRQISPNFEGFSYFNHQPKRFNSYLEPKPIGKLIKESPASVKDQVVSYITKKKEVSKVAPKDESKNEDVQFNYLPHVNINKDFEEPKVMLLNPQEFSSNFNSYDTENWFKTVHSEMNRKVFDAEAPKEMFYGVVPNVKRLHPFFSENVVNDLLLNAETSTVAKSEEEIGNFNEEYYGFNFLPLYDKYNDFADMNQKIENKLTSVDDGEPPATMFYGVLPSKEKLQDFKSVKQNFGFDSLLHREMFKEFEEMNQKIMDFLPDKSAPATMFYGVLPNKGRLQEFQQTHLGLLDRYRDVDGMNQKIMDRLPDKSPPATMFYGVLPNEKKIVEFQKFHSSKESSEVDDDDEEFVFREKGFNELPYVKNNQIFDTKIYFQLVLDKVKRQREEALKKTQSNDKIKFEKTKFGNANDDHYEEFVFSNLPHYKPKKLFQEDRTNLGEDNAGKMKIEVNLEKVKELSKEDDQNIEATTSSVGIEEGNEDEDLSFNSLPLFDQKQKFQFVENDDQKTLNIDTTTSSIVIEDEVSEDEDLSFNSLPLFDQKQEFQFVENYDQKTLNIETTTSSIVIEDKVSEDKDLSFNSLPLFDQKQEFQFVENDDQKTLNIETTTSSIVIEDEVSKNEDLSFNSLPLFDQKQEFQLVKTDDQSFLNFDSDIEKVVNEDAEESFDNEDNNLTDLYDVRQLVKPKLNQSKVEKKIQELEKILSEGVDDLPKNDKIVKNQQDFFTEVGSAIGQNFGTNLAEDFRKFVHNLKQNEDHPKTRPFNIYKPAVKFNSILRNITEDQYIPPSTVAYQTDDLPNLEDPRIVVPSGMKAVNLDENTDGILQALDQILKIEATTTANNRNSDEIVKNLGVKSFSQLNSHRGDVMDDLESDESVEEDAFEEFPLDGHKMLYLSKVYNPEEDVDGKKLLAFMYPEFGKRIDPETK